MTLLHSFIYCFIHVTILGNQSLNISLNDNFIFKKGAIQAYSIKQYYHSEYIFHYKESLKNQRILEIFYPSCNDLVIERGWFQPGKPILTALFHFL